MIGVTNQKSGEGCGVMKYKTWVAVAIGGFMGAISRYWLSLASMAWGRISMNILVINLLGAFLLAIFLEISMERLRLSPHARTGISTGFLGAFTTFSGLCSEAFILNASEGTMSAGVYLSLSLAGGLCAVFAGIMAARVLLVRPGEFHE